MKRIVSIVSLLVAIAATSQAQKLNTNKVPNAVKTAFSKAHANVSKADWSKESENFEAEFSLNGKEASELYSVNGAFLESEVEIKASELPTAIKLKLKNQKITETAKITKANGTIIYEAEVKGKDLLFDINGNSVKP